MDSWLLDLLVNDSFVSMAPLFNALAGVPSVCVHPDTLQEKHLWTEQVRPVDLIPVAYKRRRAMIVPMRVGRVQSDTILVFLLQVVVLFRLLWLQPCAIVPNPSQDIADEFAAAIREERELSVAALVLPGALAASHV